MAKMMTEYIEICYPGGCLTFLPGLLPAPAAQLRTILKWAEEADVDAVGPIKEWAEAKHEELQKEAEKWEKRQLESLDLFWEKSAQRDKDRALLKSFKDKDRYEQEAAILRENIKDETAAMQRLRDCRADEIAARKMYERALKQLDKNKELIRQWEEQRKPTSPT